MQKAAKTAKAVAATARAMAMSQPKRVVERETERAWAWLEIEMQACHQHVTPPATHASPHAQERKKLSGRRQPAARTQAQDSQQTRTRNEAF